MEEHISTKLKLGVGIILFLGFVYIIFANASFIRELAQGYGLVGLFFASLIANATVFLPMPIDIVVLAINAESASLMEVIIFGIVVGAGAGIGEMTAYFAGLLGVKTAEKIKDKEFEQIRGIREKIEKLGMKFIFFVALVPFPFDIIGVTAGFIKYNPKKFFVAALLGKTARFIILGVAAFYGFSYVKGFFDF